MPFGILGSFFIFLSDGVFLQLSSSVDENAKGIKNDGELEMSVKIPAGCRCGQYFITRIFVSTYPNDECQQCLVNV